MKKLCSIFLAAAVLAGLLAAPVYAAPSAGGLSAFADVADYAPGTFSDVSAESWYADGVRTVCQKGIMNGVGGGRFDPSEPITWTQAVVIAARLHSTYHGRSLEQSDQSWHFPARAYAYEHRLISSGRFWGPWPDAAPITRQEMAQLFRNVLDSADLPAVNDAVLTDLDAIAPDFRPAVEELCAAGIFTGRDNGKFDPEGTATRAETAVIVSRLLDPGQRVSRDLRVPRSLREWGGNFYNGGLAAPGIGVTYFLYSDREYALNGGFIEHGCEIIARADSGEARTVFACPDPLDALLLGDDGTLYVGGPRKLRRVDPSTGSDKVLYTAPDLLISYTLYDGSAYVLERYEGGSDPANWRYRIGRVMENGVLDVLTDGMSFAQSVPASRLSCFDGKLYFAMRDASTNADCLYAVCLSSKALDRVLDRDTRLTGYPSSGSTVWYVREAADGLAVLRACLALPGVETQAAVLPSQEGGPSPDIFANGGQLYLLSPGAGLLQRVCGGALETVLDFGGPAVSCTVLEDCVIIQAGDSSGTPRMDEAAVFLPDGTRVPYLEYLGKP